MKRLFYKLILIAFVISIYPKIIVAGVDLPWSTTYDCGEWGFMTDGNDPGCDGLTKLLGQVTPDGNEEQITSAANYPGGGGGRGQRHWKGDNPTVSSTNSGGSRIEFSSPHSEVWIRWYMRYEIDFEWGTSIAYDKWLYIDFGYSTAVVPLWAEFDRVQTKGVRSAPGNGWNTVMSAGTTDARGNKRSDGQWHLYEFHIKMDTDGTDGVGEIWIDEVLRLSLTNINYTTGVGFKRVGIGSNQAFPNNGRDMAVDYDDIAIRNTGYIGPIGSTDTTPPSPPTNLSIQ